MVACVEVAVQRGHGALSPGIHGPAVASMPTIDQNSEELDPTPIQQFRYILRPEIIALMNCLISSVPADQNVEPASMVQKS
jgi:hypothetical protein